MTKVNFLRNAVKTVAVLAAVTVMTACNSGGGSKQNGETKTEVKSETKSNGLFDIKDSEITVEDGSVL